MKITVLLFFAFSIANCYAQDSSNIYQLQFKGIDSNQINMADFKGKQILVIEFDPLNFNKQQLISIDSLHKSRVNSLRVIGIPVNNADTIIQKSALTKLLRDTLGLSFTLSNIGKAKKNANSSQHNLLKWITHVSSNKHFDDDITEGGQMFMISQSGVLYAPLLSYTSMNGTIMQQVLDNQPLTD